jgi:uncharacterized membrane protein
MSRVHEFIKTTVVGGLLVVLPIGVVLMLAVRSVKAIRNMLAPAMSHLPHNTHFPLLLAGLIVLAVCFLTGLIIQTRIGKRIGSGFENRVLARLPGYIILKRLSQQAFGQAEEAALKPALLETGEGLMPALIVEEHGEGNVTVFVPAVPTPTSGQLYIVRRERVHPVDVPFTRFIRCVSKWGVGSGQLLKPVSNDRFDAETPVCCARVNP